MTTTREKRAAELAAAAVARAAAHAEDWGSTAAPRRPRNGHGADCPRQMDPRFRDARRCGLCWADGNGAEPSSQVPEEEVPQVSELRSCLTCFAPTTDPEGHCT